MGIRLLFLSGIIYLIYMLPQNFFRLDYFNINKVNVTDNSKMLHDELTKLTEKLYNKNSIYIDRNKRIYRKRYKSRKCNSRKEVLRRDRYWC